MQRPDAQSYITLFDERFSVLKASLLVTFRSSAYVSVGGRETRHEVWKYNGALNKWIQVEPMSTGRWRHKMAVHGGKVYALGGFDGVTKLSSVEAYDPFHNHWTQVNIQEV